MSPVVATHFQKILWLALQPKSSPRTNFAWQRLLVQRFYPFRSVCNSASFDAQPSSSLSCSLCSPAVGLRHVPTSPSLQANNSFTSLPFLNIHKTSAHRSLSDFYRDAPVSHQPPGQHAGALAGGHGRLLPVHGQCAARAPIHSGHHGRKCDMLPRRLPRLAFRAR